MTARIIVGNCMDKLSTLPEKSAQTCITSPPYWGLRDYDVDGQLGLERVHDCLGWATGEMWELRDDLTDDEIIYVYNELKRAAAL